LDRTWRDLGEPILNVGGGWSPTVYEVATLVAQRCAAIFGAQPEITRPAARDGEVSAPLDYVIDRLLATGFSLKGDAAAEIDRTLMLCASHFASDL